MLAWSRVGVCKKFRQTQREVVYRKRVNLKKNNKCYLLDAGHNQPATTINLVLCVVRLYSGPPLLKKTTGLHSFLAIRLYITTALRQCKVNIEANICLNESFATLKYSVSLVLTKSYGYTRLGRRTFLSTLHGVSIQQGIFW